ncbi:hypothetical protein [Actinomarinicola tropica]|uniref:HTH luxR-type domain-containing protein n=1 Tax=Actinomarinicola tropica TaxID=2789776 RepID=A0A5Q2RJ29_9ACTN|nr:hypothetical protein [Actinomarinicola tropica]QGG94396.1 hypothetical protein GH723_04360 [Actinomarinicola tropica]
MDEGQPPLVVVEGTPGDVAQRRRFVERHGWVVVDGWRTPAPRTATGPVVRAGTVVDSEGAAAVVLAALEGDGVLVHATASGGTGRELVDQLCDDLRRIGPLEHHVGGSASSDAPVLDDDQERLIELLAGGMRLGDAAAALHISRRTADRRLAAARLAYGAPTTAALLAAHARR